MSHIIDIINSLLENNSTKIDEWFESKFLIYNPVFNTSVDIRSSDYKISAIDTNIFPAGYNNFNQISQTYTSTILKEYLRKHHSQCNKIMIAIENHTRNIKYVDNVLTLKNMLCSIGFNVIVANHDIKDSHIIISEKGDRLEVFTIEKLGGLITTNNNFIPDLIIINNDLTKGIPETFIIETQAQKLIPLPYLGWFNRFKSRHFSIYNKLSIELCREFNIDSWLISTLISDCHKINFMEKDGMNRIAEKVEILIKQILEKFQQYQIKENPCVFVKADKGTYGMGIMVVHSGDEILQINKKTRNKMYKMKDNQIIKSVFIQEGIPTNELFNNMSSEALVYNIGFEPVCFLCRYHDSKDKLSNLNAPGCNFIDVSQKTDNKKLSAWKLISKLAALSSSVEQAELLNNNSNVT